MGWIWGVSRVLSLLFFLRCRQSTGQILCGGQQKTACLQVYIGRARAFAGAHQAEQGEVYAAPSLPSGDPSVSVATVTASEHVGDVSEPGDLARGCQSSLLVLVYEEFQLLEH